MGNARARHFAAQLATFVPGQRLTAGRGGLPVAQDDFRGKTRADRSFRAKLVDQNGRIETTIFILAGSEQEALEQVRGLTQTYSIELWDGGRLIASIPFGRADSRSDKP